MQKRYEGLLRPQRPAPWPSRWVILATSGECVPIPDRPSIRTTGLSRWHAVVMHMKGQAVKRSESHTGAEPSGVWRLLDGLLGLHGQTWVMSVRALRDWTLLGLWERLESGCVSIAPPRRASYHRSAERGMGHDPGMLIAGDPPSAAVLRIGERERRLLWVCQQNYGWGRGSPADVGAEACTRLAGAVASASSLLSAYKLGGWQCTVGAMACAGWRGHHMEEPLYVAGRLGEDTLTAGAGFGGRCLAPLGRLLRPYAWVADGRSLYAHLATQSAVPWRLRHFLDAGSESLRAVYGNPAECCARVRINQLEPRFPRTREGRAVYETGTAWTVLAGAELEAAVRGDYVTDVAECCVYDLASPLEAYSRAAYAMRCHAERDGDDYSATLAKALVVSLVGKLGQRVRVWEEVEPEYNDPLWGEWIGPDRRGEPCKYRSIAGIVSRETGGGYAPHAVPSIPVFIWAAGRQWLWERMATAGLSSVIYADTDGLIVDSDGWSRLLNAGMIRDGEWGELRYVAGPVEVEVHGPKFVRIGEKIVQAGAPIGQRAVPGAPAGYWYRQPFAADAEAMLSGQWREEFRESEAG